MVANKKIHCTTCNRKCSGKVIRYQDNYYHKECFESEFNKSSSESDTVNSNNNNYVEESKHRISTTKHQYQSQRRTESSKNMVASSSSTRLNQQQHHVVGTNGSRSSQNLVGADENIMPPSDRRGQTLDGRGKQESRQTPVAERSATLPNHNNKLTASTNTNGFQSTNYNSASHCAGCNRKIEDGQSLIALDSQWHVWCFKCTHCKMPLHGDYVAKEDKAYCEKDYQKLFGVTCVYCKRYITGKVLQAGDVHHFHPSCARCSKCGDPFVPGEEMYLQGEVTWHPRCGPGPGDTPYPMDDSQAEAASRSQTRIPRAESPGLSSRSRSRSASPFSYMSQKYGRASPYADSEAVGDLSRIYTISYLNSEPNQGYLKRPIEPNPPKSPQFSRPTSIIKEGSRCSSRSQYYSRDRSVPRGMYSVLSSMRSGSSTRARSPSMMNEEAIHLAQYPSGQKPSPDAVPKIERDDFPAPPFPHHPDRLRGSQMSASKSAHGNLASEDYTNGNEETSVKQRTSSKQRASRPRSREIVIDDDENSLSGEGDPRFKKEEEELSKIASGIGKIFLQTLKEREKLRAWKRSNLDPRNASRTPSATRELPSRMRYDNPTNASPSRDLDRPRPWEDDDDHSPTRTRSSLGKPSQMSSSSYGYKVVQSNRLTPKPGYGLQQPPTSVSNFGQFSTSNSNILSNGDNVEHLPSSELTFRQHQRLTQNRSSDLLGKTVEPSDARQDLHLSQRSTLQSRPRSVAGSNLFGAAHLRRSMPNVNTLHHIHRDGPPKLYPYHLLVTSNYRLPPDVDRCHLERHLSNEEFQFIFQCNRLEFYSMPEWKRNELKRRARLF